MSDIHHHTIISDKLYNWASHIEHGALEQAAHAAKLPVVAGVRLMPDAHVGIGATVGSVIATDSAMIPSAVGVDIGCGMIAAKTNLTASMLPDAMEPYLDRIMRAIPAGIGPRGGHGNRLSHNASEWRSQNRAHADLTLKQEQTILQQFGTLGSGNHFFEVCLDESDNVWVMLHSGSRGIGNQLGSYHIAFAKDLYKAAMGELQRQHDRIAGQLRQGLLDGDDLKQKLAEIQEEQRSRHLDDVNLAYFVQGTAEFAAYVNDMLFAQSYAMANRNEMMSNAMRELFAYVGTGEEVQRVNCHHNYAALERHGGRDLWITRKGAIKAERGDLGLIPGSMGARSYVVRGLGNEASYHSSPHGAGRSMSRGQARKTITADRLREQMSGKVWRARDANALLDEAPDAYKPIDVIMQDSASLVEVVHELRQILNYKGYERER